MCNLLFPVCVTADMFDVAVGERETSADPDVTWLFHQSVFSGFLPLNYDSCAEFMTARTELKINWRLRDKSSDYLSHLFLLFIPLPFFFSPQ